MLLIDNSPNIVINKAMSQAPDYDFYKPIAGNIRKLRSEARPKISQEELAEKTGLSRAAIANIERGRQQILIHVLFNIAKALNVTPDKLLPTSNSPLANSTGSSHGFNQEIKDDLKKQLPNNYKQLLKSLENS